MNGVRCIFRRKGYLLTALAAAVLLAASSGTALAQVTITGPAMNTVNEGDTATYTVDVKGFIAPSAGVESLVVTLEPPAPDAADSGTAGEVPGDVNQNLGATYTVAVPAGQTGDDAVPVAFNRSGSIRLQTSHDLDAEDEKFTLSFTLNPVGLVDEDDVPISNAIPEDDRPAALTINDDETQTYVLSLMDPKAKPEEGEDVMVTLAAVPEHVSGSGMLTLNLDKPAPDYGLSIMQGNGNVEGSPAVTIGAGDAATATITVDTDDNDENRVTDTITLTAYSGRAGASVLEDTLPIKLVDANVLPAVVAMVVDKDGKVLEPQPTSVAEGESVMVVVMPLDDDGEDPADAGEKLTVALTPTGTADAADYALVGTFTIPSGMDVSNRVELEVRTDEDVGMESLMFDATVSGLAANGTETSASAGILSLYIEDGTTKRIEPKATEADYDAIKATIAAAGGDDDLNPGETFALMTSDLFDVMPGYSASYGASVNNDAVSVSTSGDMVTITADMAGTAEVTITGTATMGSSSLAPSQTVSNVASLKFPVTVVDTELVVTVSADPMEIDEGGTSMITAMASRAITVGDGDVAIDLTVVGDGELDADSIMIAMGDMSGSAVLTSTEDDDMDNETVTVVATGSGITGTMQVAIAVADNDVVVAPEALVVTVTAEPEAIDEGGTSEITATASRMVEAGDGEVTIALEVVAGDATLDADSIAIAEGAMSGSATLTATEDDDDYADGSVTVLATGAGIEGAMQVKIAVADNDTAPPPTVDPVPDNTIWPRSQEEAYPVITDAIEMGAGEDGLNPGESFSVPASELFTVMDGYEASYSASVDGDAASATVSGDSVDVMAGAAGAAKVTITGTSKMASSSFLPEQVATNVADITFEVMVVDKPLAALVVTLGMPANVMDGNIVEGESYDIVASANRMVTAAEGSVEVMIMRDRAASDAGEEDYSVSSATIMAGYDSAMATLMVTEDNDPDSGTNDNMGESLVLYGMAGDMETNSLTFTIWDQAVPSLPLIGQMLLALFLMLGGARLYRRRQQG